MVAIRICKWCGAEFDAYVGHDGIHCSAKCKKDAASARAKNSVSTVCIPENTEASEYFDELPAMSHEEIEEAIARICRRETKSPWR